MVNLANGKAEFYQCKVSYYDNGELKSEYTNNPSLYTEMVNNYKYLSNCTVEAVTYTLEQKGRLEEFNALLTDEVVNSGLEGQRQIINNFIENGYVDSNCPDYMKSLLSSYEANSKTILTTKLSKQLSSFKTEKEYGGAYYGEYELATDLESQSKVSSVFMSINAGLVSTVDFKFKNGYVNMTAEEFQKVAVFLLAHVQACFTAESMVKDSFANMTFDELLALDPDNVNRDEMIMTQDEFGNDVTTRNNENNKLKELYDSTYNTIMAAAFGTQEETTTEPTVEETTEPTTDQVQEVTE